jgi:hypothetical protein
MIRSVIFDGSWTRKEFDVRLALDANEHPARRAFITSGLLYTPVVPRRDPVRASTPSIPLPRSLSFNRICYAFVFDPKENSWRQRFRISFVSESLAGRDFQPLVEEIARAFVHACVIAEDRFGWTTRYASDGVVDIWITDAGPPRAEQSAIAPGHIFFYSSATPRTPAEWLREVFHEYGHLVLPPVDGFVKAEEPFATGLMGEALLLPVLASAGETLPFEASRDDLRTLLEKRLKRPSGLFLQEGPNSSLIQDTTDAGVAYALSFVLHVLERHGPEGVEALFAALPVQAIVRTHDLIRAHEAWLRGKEQTSVRIDAVLQEGGTARTWLYLPWPAIELIVSTDSEVRAATTITLKGATITREGIVIQSGKSIDTQTSLRGLKAGWHLVTFELKAASAPVRLDSVSYRPIQ